MSERKGSLTVAGKGNKQREVPLNADARKALQQWLEVRPKAESEALFLGRGGVPLGPRGVQGVLTDLGKRAQVEDLHLNDGFDLWESSQGSPAKSATHINHVE